MQTEGGDCYQAAGIFFMDGRMRVDTPSTLTLVHGYPTLQREPFKKFGHAWCEFKNPWGQWMVRDTSNGKDVEMSRDAYYHLGKIDPAECRYYNTADLRRWVTETGHWGPWEETDEQRGYDQQAPLWI